MSQIAVHDITWNDFPGPLPDGDTIDMSLTNGLGSTQFQVILTTSPEVTWYKEIKAFDAEQNAVGWISTQDSWHGPTAMTLSTETTVSLVFTKAKGFGIHTGEYDVANIPFLAGKVASFNWTAD